MVLSPDYKFSESLEGLIRLIPQGKVSTCGDLAIALGDIRAARAVGYFLRGGEGGGDARMEKDVPLHRVVLSDGSLGDWACCSKSQADVLLKEGVTVVGGKVVDLDTIRFNDFKVRGRPLLVKLREEQIRSSEEVSLEDREGEVDLVCGLDVGYYRRGDLAKGAGVCYDVDTKEEVHVVTVEGRPPVPYISTYLAFRELPLLVKVVRKVTGWAKDREVLFLVDGNGVLHPNRIGIASHLGVLENCRAIGVAKSKLCGEVEWELKRRWDHAPIVMDNERIGTALLSSPRGKKPIYISPGHLVSHDTALRVVRDWTSTRIPGPIIGAHNHAKCGP